MALLLRKPFETSLAVRQLPAWSRSKLAQRVTTRVPEWFGAAW